MASYDCDLLGTLELTEVNHTVRHVILTSANALYTSTDATFPCNPKIIIALRPSAKPTS
jgi:hypothetical protein